MKGFPSSWIAIVLLLLDRVVSFSVQIPRSRVSVVAMFSASSSSSTKSNASAKTTVVYQKVIRMPPKMPDILFLGSLVEYLQDIFRLPDRLPMVYEKQNFEYDPEFTNRKAPVMMRLDSPLSPLNEATALNVQVVGIYSNEKSSLPDMAMVVVDKDADTNRLPPMMKGLFADSENKILKALDKGLEDFMAGKIKGLDGSNKRNVQQQTFQEGKEAILEEVLLSSEAEANTKQSSDFIEADIVHKEMNGKESDGEHMTHQKRLQQREAALKTMQAKASAQPKMKDPGLEFTIQAAKEAQAQRKRRKEQGREDFAVVAAQKARGNKKQPEKSPAAIDAVATTKSTNQISSPPRTTTQKKASTFETSKCIKSESVSDTPTIEGLDLYSIRPPVLDPNVSGVQRKFMKSISTPTQFASHEKAHLSKKNTDRSTSSSPPRNTSKMISNVSKPKSTKDLDGVTGQPGRVKQDQNKSDNSQKESPKLAISKTKGKDQTIQTDIVMDENQDSEIYEQILHGAEQALTEMAELGKEMTAEEILKDVIKFGETQNQETAVGSGFATGVFEQAKNMLRHQKTIRDQKRQQNTEKGEENSNLNQNARQTSVQEISPDEELRRMFEAGERIVDGRLTVMGNRAISTVSSTTSTTENYIEDIINSDTSVSRHARILDDELAELKVRINKSPGESQDGPNSNPLFDIFSGPEVYNPNVDPETAVNWPGALPGTKNIRLPNELDNAVKQANFAAEVLMSLQEKQSDDGSIKYMVGKRELSEQDIQNLRTVVEEAVEIGIIDDPRIILDENARLQMILGELFHQPEERVREIASNYKDLLLSDNFPLLVKNRLDKMANREMRNEENSLEETHTRERELLGQLIVYAQLLLKEAQALGAELESQHLEVVRSICKVAMDPTHRTEEETAVALTDAVKDMRPLFDDSFVAYLKYAIAEEEGRLARAGVLDDPDHNQWLFVLKIVQQGVYKELSIGINRYLEHIWYILRMETPAERRMLLEKLVDAMPTLDVRPFVKVVDNIVGALGDSVKGEFDGVTPLGEMTNKLLQLHRDVKEVLPPERIAEKSKDADEWAAKQKQRLLEQRKLTKQRLKAAHETEYLDGELQRQGELERFD
jgi:hypothetical protein